MTNTGLENHRPSNEEELPVVLLHGTSGQSEDWSQVVEQLTRHRAVIRLNYGEPVAGTDSANAPRVSDFADRVVAAAGAGGTHRFDLVGYSLGAAVAAISLWNTVYLERAILALRQRRPVDDAFLKHLSPLGWEHINLTGDYVWHANKRVAAGRFRPLRFPKIQKVPS